MTLTIGSTFSGYDGLGLAVERIWPNSKRVWFSDWEKGPDAILGHHWPHIPNHGDITTMPWEDMDHVDIYTGGFPCQDLSLAGGRSGMHSDSRSGLWAHMAKGISILRPKLVIAENVRGLLSGKAHSKTEQCEGCLDGSTKGHRRALGTVLADLAELGYDAQWVGLRASDVGAPHQRFRVFVVAQDADAGGRGSRFSGDWTVSDLQEHTGAPSGSALFAAHTHDLGRQWTRDPRGWSAGSTDSDRSARFGDFGPAVARWEALTRPAPEPTAVGPKGAPRLAPEFVEWMMGLPAGHVTNPAIGLTRVQQLRALGNGVVPQQAETAIRYLLGLTMI